jgi:hypothetical protein
MNCQLAVLKMKVIVVVWSLTRSAIFDHDRDCICHAVPIFYGGIE